MPWAFTPPVVNDVPPILPDGNPANALFKFYKPRARGVNVFQRQDGTFVQDTPTAENQHSDVPYPIGPDNVVNRGWDPFTLTPFETLVDNPVVFTYYGGRTHIVSDDTAAQLTNAGYGPDLVQL